MFNFLKSLIKLNLNSPENFKYLMFYKKIIKFN